MTPSECSSAISMRRMKRTFIFIVQHLSINCMSSLSASTHMSVVLIIMIIFGSSVMTSWRYFPHHFPPLMRHLIPKHYTCFRCWVQVLDIHIIHIFMDHIYHVFSDFWLHCCHWHLFVNGVQFIPHFLPLFPVHLLSDQLSYPSLVHREIAEALLYILLFDMLCKLWSIKSSSIYHVSHNSNATTIAMCLHFPRSQPLSCRTYKASFLISCWIYEFPLARCTLWITICSLDRASLPTFKAH